jgi:plasmid stability protein
VAQRHNVQAAAMQNTTTRATIYLDSAMHKALRLKAAETHRSISEIVSDAVREALREDEEDFAAFEERAHEKSITYEALLKKLKADGTL